MSKALEGKGAMVKTDLVRNQAGSVHGGEPNKEHSAKEGNKDLPQHLTCLESPKVEAVIYESWQMV